MEDEIERLKSEIERQSIDIETIEIDLKQIDREIVLLEEKFTQVGRAFQPSAVELPELSGPIITAGPVSEPRIPITSSNPLTRRLVIGGVAGLVLGSILAYGLDYMRRSRSKRTAV